MSTEQDDVVVSDSSTETEEESSESTVESKTVPYERFKEVNEELKQLKQERLNAVTVKEQPKETPTSKSELSEDDLFAIKQVEDKESLDYARKVAHLEGISLSEALSNPLYTSWHKIRQETKKQEEAQLGASKGSGSRGKKKDFTTSGLSPKEHKELWRQRTGK